MSQEPLNEEARWLALASSGDPAAAQTLMTMCLAELVEYVRRHTSGVVAAQESASDLAQSVCRDVLGKLANGQFVCRDATQFRAWLYQSALRKIQDRGRFWARERRDARRVQPLDEQPDEVSTPSGQAITQEERQQVARARERLEPRQREVLRLHHDEGCSHKEIAERLGIEESHSRTLLARALARLARLVAPD